MWVHAQRETVRGGGDGERPGRRLGRAGAQVSRGWVTSPELETKGCLVTKVPGKRADDRSLVHSHLVGGGLRSCALGCGDAQAGVGRKDNGTIPGQWPCGPEARIPSSPPPGHSRAPTGWPSWCLQALQYSFIHPSDWGCRDSNAQARPLWSPGVGAAPTSWWPSPSGPPASPSHLRSAPKNILLSGTTQGHPPQPALDPEPIWEPTVLLTAMKQRRGAWAAPRVSG